jgi:hypothetical protein
LIETKGWDLRRAASLVVAVAVCLSATAGCSKKAGSVDGAKRVLVFGMDGATWDVIEPMMAAGELPNLKALSENGVRGVLESRNPALSPVVWSTIFTGRPHEEHGVLNWKTSQSRHRKVKTIWEMASERGLVTNIFNVPSTYPPIPINGVMVSGFPLGGSTIGGNTGIVVTSKDLDSDDVIPNYKLNAPRIRRHMKALETGEWSPWFDVRIRVRPTWIASMRIKKLEKDKFYLSPIYRQDDEYVLTFPADVKAMLREDVLDDRPYVAEGPGWSKHAEPDTPSYLSEHLTQVAEIQTDVAASFAGGDWQLFVFINTLVDRVSHPYWAYANAADYKELPPAKAKRYEEDVADAYRKADAQLGQVLNAAKGEFYVMIASDHGFKSSPVATAYIGTHHLDGIYMVSGPGIEPGRGERAFIEDIGPTALYLMGLPLGEDMTGGVIPEVERDLGRPVDLIASWEDGVARGSARPVDAETWEQLKGLGYVEGDAPTAD